VTHDVFEAVRLADRIGVMVEGRLIQVATPAELVREPANEVALALLGRHRFQLRLMTVRLAEVLASVPDELPADTDAIDADAADSVWSAFDRMESAGAGAVRVEVGGRARVVSRSALLERVGSP
jgi:osmoprotectant transport system ATP-binding protein